MLFRDWPCQGQQQAVTCVTVTFMWTRPMHVSWFSELPSDWRRTNNRSRFSSSHDKVYSFIHSFSRALKHQFALHSIRSYFIWRPQFQRCSSKNWNSLLPSLQMWTSHDTFRHQLKPTTSSRPSNPLSASDSSLADHCACLQIIFTYLLTYSQCIHISQCF